MKLGKIKGIYLAFLTVILAVFIFGLFAVNSGYARAEEDATVSLGGSYYSNFIYSAEFTPNGGATRAGFVFGADDDAHWIAAAETSEGSVALYRNDEKESQLKSIGHEFKAGEKLKITLVVNEGVAKMFIGSESVAALTCKIDGYEGGKVGTVGKGFDVSGVALTETDTPDGDIYIGGYTALKVVNLTDGNKILSADNYSLKGGVLTVKESYLKTLEANTEYSFRVVTSFTDFNFKINTNFTSVTATPTIEKYYRNNDVTLELSASVTVNKLLLDGKECAFTQTGDRVVISSEYISSLSTGKHSIKLFTEKGRPETTITVSEIVETITEPEVKSTHMWLWIDLSIFAAAIIGYVTFSIVMKRKKK